MRRTVLLTIGLWTVTFGLLQGDPRYHLPLLPLLCALAADGLAPAARVKAQSAS